MTHPNAGPGTGTASRLPPPSTPSSSGWVAWIRTLGAVYRWEAYKQIAQKRSWLGLAAAAITPVLILISIEANGVTPGDGPYADPLGTALRHTGLSLVPVVLTEITYFGPAVLAALVSGDSVAGEEMAGTLKTIATRSVRRSQILLGKTLAVFSYLLVALLISPVVGILAGVVAWGYGPITDLSGHPLTPTHAMLLTAAAIAIYAAPVLAMASLGVLLSVLTRHSVAAIIALVFLVMLMQGLGAISSISTIRPYLLNPQLAGWQGVFRSPTDWAGIGHTLWVSALYVVVPLVAADRVFNHRDMAS